MSVVECMIYKRNSRLQAHNTQSRTRTERYIHSLSYSVHVRYFAVIIINQSELMENKMKATADEDESEVLAMCESTSPGRNSTLLTEMHFLSGAAGFHKCITPGIKEEIGAAA